MTKRVKGILYWGSQAIALSAFLVFASYDLCARHGIDWWEPTAGMVGVGLFMLIIGANCA